MFYKEEFSAFLGDEREYFSPRWWLSGASGGFAQDGQGNWRGASATLSCQSSDGPDLHVSEAALCLSVPEKPGGGYRNRTGLHGFAIRCVTSPPTRHPLRCDRIRGTRCDAQGRGTDPAATSCTVRFARFGKIGTRRAEGGDRFCATCFDSGIKSPHGGSLPCRPKRTALSEGRTGKSES